MDEKFSSKEILDFYEQHNFQLSDDAKKKLEDNKELKPEDLAVIAGGGCGKGCNKRDEDWPYCTIVAGLEKAKGVKCSVWPNGGEHCPNCSFRP